MLEFWLSSLYTWPLVCMEEGNQSGELAISGGHGNTQEESAMRRRRSLYTFYSILFDVSNISYM